jgi:hypothetical protein
MLERTRVWKLVTGHDWESFERQVKEALGEVEWSADFEGEEWCDSTRAPSKNTTIKVSRPLHGGDPTRRVASTQVFVAIDEHKTFKMGLLRGQEWTQFARCMRNLVGHEDWYAVFDGKEWLDFPRTPERGHTIAVHFKFPEGGKIIILLLGLAPAGYLAAPDNGA